MPSPSDILRIRAVILEAEAAQLQQTGCSELEVSGPWTIDNHPRNLAVLLCLAAEFRQLASMLESSAGRLPVLWFGEPWLSYICYDETGRRLDENRVPFPEGKTCLWCTEPVRPGESGIVMPHIPSGLVYAHHECSFRNVTGSVSCMKGEHNHDSGRSYREEALDVWAYAESLRNA
jgi:hypothetical protein